jgi:pimeloyl-[acyl-carrier protein] methyl ester esterase
MTATSPEPPTGGPASGAAGRAFLDAERALLAEYGIAAESRSVRLADPALGVRVLETGAGRPLVLIHGSGMSAPTWAPMLAELGDRRIHAVDLPGFGLSDARDYSGRRLRDEAVAQIGSLLDALGLERATLAGTSFGAMCALYMALDRPERVDAVIGYGVPAVSLPGMKGNAFFRAMTTPGIRALVSRVPAPRTAAGTRKAMRDAIGARASERLPDSYFEVVRATMAMPAWRRAMSTHLNRAMRSGRPREENLIADDELRSLELPVRLVFGDADAYGPPSIGERAVALMPDATLEVIPGGHAPFLDDPRRCAEVVRGL